MTPPAADSWARTTRGMKSLLQRWRGPTVTPDLDAIASSASCTTEDGREVPRTEQVSVRYGRLLHQLVSEYCPERMLEIGMATGISAAYAARARQCYAAERPSRQVIVDPFQTVDWAGGGRALLDRLGLSTGVEVIEATSLLAVPRLEQAGDRFDFIFIDGNHCFDYLMADLVMADRVLDIGGMMVLDDGYSFGVRTAISYASRHRPNLRRVLLDPPLLHWFRERTLRRRRFAVFQKVAHDARGASAF